MSTLDDRRRLAQAQRVTVLKMRRCERVRQQAVRAESEARARADAARRQADAAAQISGDARSAFYAHPADPQVETWMLVTAERTQAAAQDRRIAAEQHDVAQADAAAARREHERAIERSALIEAKASALCRMMAGRLQDREDQEMEECRR